MKKPFLSLLALAFALLVTGPAASAFPVSAACVGGPRAPAYAFNNWWQAQQCRNVIARQSRDCARFVRTGVCKTENYQVNAVPAYACECNPARAAIGYWQ